MGKLLCTAPVLSQPGALGCHPWLWAGVAPHGHASAWSVAASALLPAPLQLKYVCPFFLLEYSRPPSPWGPLDFLSTYLGNDSLSLPPAPRAIIMVTYKSVCVFDLFFFSAQMESHMYSLMWVAFLTQHQNFKVQLHFATKPHPVSLFSTTEDYIKIHPSFLTRDQLDCSSLWPL